MSEALVRPALHLAFLVAQAGMAADPPVEPPRALRPFLRFTRLPDRALVVLRGTLDDDEFRARVAEEAVEDALGRPGWLFVVRPPGWREELGEIAGASQAVADAAREDKEERSAQRRLARAEELLERSEKVAARALADAAKATEELAEERRARRATEREATTSAARADVLEQEAAGSRRRIENAKLELARWRAKVAQLEAELARVATAAPIDTVVLNEAVTSAGDALAGVQRAVADVEAQIDAQARREPSAETTLSSPGLSSPDPTVGPGGRPARPQHKAHRPSSTGRRPVPLPPAVFEDSPEAASHLVRVRDVVLLVDGYNAAMSIWAGLGTAEFRGRLVDALSELSARTGAEVHVVFDGADLDGSVARAGGRVPVRVTFSPPEVEADDVILDLVEELPPGRPVVVVSSDRRVQEGARARGANVLSSAQLGGLVGR